MVSISPSPLEKSPRAVQALEPGDYAVSAFQVRPTENSSEWICEVYYRGELIWNWTVVGELKGELSDPLNPYVEECMKYPGWLMTLTGTITLEEFNNTLPEGIYKYGGTYYEIGKIHETTHCFSEVVTPQLAYSWRHTIQIWPPTPTTASGATLATCWIALGVFVIKRRREPNVES
jgi:hypothetical protein